MTDMFYDDLDYLLANKYNWFELKALNVRFIFY